VPAQFSFILRQEKIFFQVKLLCYNLVNQMYCRSRTLVDGLYVLISSIFLSSDCTATILKILYNIIVTVTVQELSAKGVLEGELSVN